jgi:hypothetical protein
MAQVHWAFLIWTGMAALAVVLAGANPIVICDPACADVRSAVLIDILSWWLVGAVSLALARLVMWLWRKPARSTRDPKK